MPKLAPTQFRNRTSRMRSHEYLKSGRVERATSRYGEAIPCKMIVMLTTRASGPTCIFKPQRVIARIGTTVRIKHLQDDQGLGLCAVAQV